MILRIKLNKVLKEITVKPGNGKPLVINEEVQDWNSNGINNFLIRVVSSNVENEDLTIEYEEDEEDVTYKFIVQLFQTFIEKYNS